ncbi:MAG: L,D-transpeptidase [Anaerolineales bacterium]|jgi:lipoprotein-anchoring transpeptidase ErfK/SrfK
MSTIDQPSINSKNSQDSITRRDFLKLGSSGMAGLFLEPMISKQEPVPDQMGRVAEMKTAVFDRPSFQGNQTDVYWKDMILPITLVTVGDLEPSHNRIWYRVNKEGFVHSGSIQPVKTQLQEPISNIPITGTLAEVTVPYTDVHWGPGKNNQFAYRIYYETTHWVSALVQDPQGNPWYQIQEDKWDMIYYAPANHMRVIPQSEIAPLSPGIPPSDKRIEVRLRDQLAIAYEKNNPVFMARVASGAEFSNGRFLTPVGQYKTFHKRPSRHMAAGDLASNGYDLPGVPWICYINEKGVAFHGTYWHNDFGRPRSHGCINLTSSAAKWIYRWTLPNVPPYEESVYENFGTIVDIFE